MFGLDRAQSCEVSQQQGQEPLHPGSPKDPRDPCMQRIHKFSTYCFFAGATSSLG